MKKFEVNRLYEMAIKKWGADSQIAKAVEECAELIVALARNESIDKILDEMVDVEIMIEQLKLIFDYSFDDKSTVFDALKRGKLRRLEKRLNEWICCPNCNGNLKKVIQSYNMYKCNKCGTSVHGTDIK